MKKQIEPLAFTPLIYCSSQSMGFYFRYNMQRSWPIYQTLVQHAVIMANISNSGTICSDHCQYIKHQYYMQRSWPIYQTSVLVIMANISNSGTICSDHGQYIKHWCYRSWPKYQTSVLVIMGNNQTLVLQIMAKISNNSISDPGQNIKNSISDHGQ